MIANTTEIGLRGWVKFGQLSLLRYQAFKVTFKSLFFA